MDIWALWLQGRESAPRFVQENLGLWERLNSEHRLTVLSQRDADGILEDLGISQPKITAQVTANLVRSHLLARHGGVWVDSTLLPTMPLSNWFTPDLRSQGFFAFRSMGHRDLVLQNWFLYAEAGNPLITAWLNDYADYFRTLRRFPAIKRVFWHGEILDYLRYRRAVARRDFLWFIDPARGRDCVFYPYATHNYHFSFLLKRRPDLRALWGRVPRRSAHLPEVIGEMSRDPETTAENLLASIPEVLKISPVHKLTHHNPLFAHVPSMVVPGIDPVRRAPGAPFAEIQGTSKSYAAASALGA